MLQFMPLWPHLLSIFQKLVCQFHCLILKNVSHQNTYLFCIYCIYFFCLMGSYLPCIYFFCLMGSTLYLFFLFDGVLSRIKIPTSVGSSKKQDLFDGVLSRIKIPTSVGSSKKQESSRKTHISALLTMPKPSTMWITINCGKFWKRWEYQTPWPTSWEICRQVRKQQVELDIEQQTVSK